MLNMLLLRRSANLQRMPIPIERRGEKGLRTYPFRFTVHRPQKLNRTETKIGAELEEEIKTAICDGYDTFILGMAYYIDIWVGKEVVRLRRDNRNIRIVVSVPFLVSKTTGH